MALKPGTQLGPYEITAPLGAGGMGEVYRATDTKLKRDVAIKVLPDDVAGDSERLARFEREAHVLASLNHPHIASIYGLEESGGVPFLVLELVEGQTLAESLAAGSLPLEEALGIANQIASALEAAHEKGVIHRDLKPANVKITPEGSVKVLDFGLAKALADESAEISGDPSHSPTLTAVTQGGLILGTAAYMSPEQARGKSVDKRTDIWAFGCVLYECLTGRQAFRGETVTDVLSAILRTEPEWSALPPNTPPRMRDLLERCLEKEAPNRLRDIGDARIDLERSVAASEWASSAAVTAAAPLVRRWRWMRWLGLTALVLISAAVGAIINKEVDTPLVTRVSIVTDPLVPERPRFSADGRAILFYATDPTQASSTGRLYTRSFDRFETVAVPGTEGVLSYGCSPDGKWLAFVVPDAAGAGRLRMFKTPIGSPAPPVAIAEVSADTGGSLVWLDGQTVVSAKVSPPFQLVFYPTEGGAAQAPIEIKAEKLEGENSQLALASVLPGGRHVLGHAARYGERGWVNNVLLFDTETGAARTIIEDASLAIWENGGRILFSRDDTLHAVAFDVASLEVTGSPVAIMGNLRGADVFNSGWFHSTPGGDLLYLERSESESGRRLMLLDAEGNLAAWSDKPRNFDFNPAVSPDGRWLATVVSNQEEGLHEIWVSGFDRPRLRPVVDVPSSDCFGVSWTPDSRSLIFSCVGKGVPDGIYRASADGTGEPELLVAGGEADSVTTPLSLSPDGRNLLAAEYTPGTGRSDIVLFRLGVDGRPKSEAEVVAEDTHTFLHEALSQDGRCLAYVSDETGRNEVYLRSFAPDGSLGPTRLASIDGGDMPFWSSTVSRAAEKLFFINEGLLYSVVVNTDGPLSFSEPVEIPTPPGLLGRIPVYGRNMAGIDALPDGRILVVQKQEADDASIRVVFNWFEELDRLVPAE